MPRPRPKYQAATSKRVVPTKRVASAKPEVPSMQVMPEVSGRSSFLQSAAIILGCSLLALVGSYSTRVLYARTFTPADYGLLYAVITWLAILGLIRNLGMGEALTYFVARNLKNPEIGRSALKVTLFVQIALGILIVLIAVVFGSLVSRTLIPDPRVPQLLLIFAIAYAVVGITEAIVAYYRGKQSMIHVGLSEPLRTIAVAAASLLALTFENSLSSIAIAWLAAYTLSAVVYSGLLLHSFRQDTALQKRASEPKHNKQLLNAMLRYAFPSFLAAAGLFVFYNADTVIITAMLGTYQTGLYNAAIPLANLLLLVTVPITIVAFPAISALAGSGKRDALMHIHALATRIGLLAAVCCAAPFLLFGPQLLGYLFGNAYTSAATALQVLLIGGIVRSLVEIEFAVLAGLGAVRARAILLAGALISNILLNIWWIPLYGITGAAVATTFSFIALLIATRLYSERVHGVHLPINFLPKFLVVVVPVVVATVLLAPRMPGVSFVVLLFLMVCTSLTAFAWSFACGLVAREDIGSAVAFCTDAVRRLRG